MKHKLKDCGIEMHSFMPVLFSKFTGQMNYRDHRKIIVIDGKIGYVGGINISDNYVNANNDKILERYAFTNCWRSRKVLYKYYFLQPGIL